MPDSVVVECVEAHAWTVCTRFERKGYRLRGLRFARHTSGSLYLFVFCGDGVDLFCAAVASELPGSLRALGPPADNLFVISLVDYDAPKVAAIPAADDHACEEDATTHHTLLRLLARGGAQFDVCRHVAVRTSEEAAAVRGATLASGAKAMLVSAKVASAEQVVLVVLAADRKLDSKRLKKELRAKGTRFVDPEEVRRLTGCVPGAVPPFGSLWGVRTLVDGSLLEQGPGINFNAGLRTRSVAMRTDDYVRIERATLCSVSSE